MADNVRYKGLKIELADDFTIGQSNYPKTMVAAKRLLMDYIATGKSNSNYFKQDSDDADVAFSETDCNKDWKKKVFPRHIFLPTQSSYPKKYLILFMNRT